MCLLAKQLVPNEKRSPLHPRRGGASRLGTRLQDDMKMEPFQFEDEKKVNSGLAPLVDADALQRL